MRTIIMIFSVLLIATACGHHESTGVSTLSIGGGVETKETDAFSKHTVALLSPEGEAFCSGTLIASDLVLTAAHCLIAAPVGFRVGFGLNFLNGDLTKVQRRDYAALVAHKDYLGQQKHKHKPNRADLVDAAGDSDIAIILLDGEAPPSHTPAQLAEKTAKINPGTKITAAGFGLTKMSPDRLEAYLSRLREKQGNTPADPYEEEQIKNHIQQYAESFKDDRGVLRHTELQIMSFPGPKKIRAFSNDHKYTCNADSGSPAYVEVQLSGLDDEMKLSVVGVASRSDCVKDSYFLDIRRFGSWLIDATLVAHLFSLEPNAVVEQNLGEKEIPLIFQ